MEFRIPNAVLLSIFSGVVGWGWPSSIRVVLMGTADLPLWYISCVSASAAELITFFKVKHSVRMGPFGFGVGFKLDTGGRSLK